MFSDVVQVVIDPEVHELHHNESRQKQTLVSYAEFGQPIIIVLECKRHANEEESIVKNSHDHNFWYVVENGVSHFVSDDC